MSSVELNEGLLGVYNSQALNGKTLTGAISSAMVPASPGPGALDVVSQMVSHVMTSFAPTFFHPTATAVGHLDQGKDAVLQSNTTYHSTDSTGGTQVAARDQFHVQ